jgi:hypothetical protein
LKGGCVRNGMRLQGIEITYFVDTVGLNCWINEFGDEFSLEILYDIVDISLIVGCKSMCLLTARKNFFAPTFKAFVSAAAKSYHIRVESCYRWITGEL